jgi:dihydrolipoamide dehydrogenase
MQDKNVKVAVIGAGTAGLSAFKEVLKSTDDCVLINGGPYGTTCARVGCMPSKVLIQVAHDFHRRRFWQEQGLSHGEDFRVDTRKVMAYVRQWRDYFAGGVARSTEKYGDKNIAGYARFVEPNVLDVDGVKVAADAIVIATGSQPVVPGPWKEFGNAILTTDDIFEQEVLPKAMGVIGAGVIGLELGQALSRLGVQTTIVEAGDFIGGLSDPMVNEYAVKAIQEECDLQVGQKADLSWDQEKLRLQFGEQVYQMDKVLAAVGRRPSIAALDLKNIGVPLDEKGMPEMDMKTLKIKDRSIFMAGDVNSYRPILHETADEGRIAGYNAVQDSPRCFRRRIPLTITFTAPQIVSVGQRYRDIKEQDIIIGEARFDTQGRSRILHKNKGILRIYAEPDKGVLMGAEMIAPEGEYIGHLLAWAIQKNMNTFEVLNMPFYHPTVLEGLRSAIRDLAKQVKNPQRQIELPSCDCLDADCFH